MFSRFRILQREAAGGGGREEGARAVEGDDTGGEVDRVEYLARRAEQSAVTPLRETRLGAGSYAAEWR